MYHNIFKEMTFKSSITYPGAKSIEIPIRILKRLSVYIFLIAILKLDYFMLM